MLRYVLSICCLLVTATVFAAPGPEMVDPAEAEKDQDFKIQGEYLGDGTWINPERQKCRIGAQVIARSEGKFQVVLFRGGLPGEGWERGDEQFALEAEREGDVTKLTKNDKQVGQIAGDILSLLDEEGKNLAQLKRAERKSPTLGAKPPKGAVVLFDGTNVDRFPGATLTDMKTLEAGCTMKPEIRMSRIHIEFRLSWKPAARGQQRSNSGVYIGGIPEIQVLDSFGLEGAKNECGAFYGRRVPDVNMCFPPLVWQTYDVQFSEPERDVEGRPTENIRVTVRHNGVVIHEGYDTRRKEHELRRLHFQKHGNRVAYRNIWAVPAEIPELK